MDGPRRSLARPFPELECPGSATPHVFVESAQATEYEEDAGILVTPVCAKCEQNIENKEDRAGVVVKIESAAKRSVWKTGQELTNHIEYQHS